MLLRSVPLAFGPIPLAFGAHSSRKWGAVPLGKGAEGPQTVGRRFADGPRAFHGVRGDGPRGGPCKLLGPVPLAFWACSPCFLGQFLLLWCPFLLLSGPFRLPPFQQKQEEWLSVPPAPLEEGLGVAAKRTPKLHTGPLGRSIEQMSFGAGYQARILGRFWRAFAPPLAPRKKSTIVHHL